jgi:hypothetical protein
MTKTILTAESTEKDITLFTSVLRRCLDAAQEEEKLGAQNGQYNLSQEVEGSKMLAPTSSLVAVSPLVAFVAPLWPDLWAILNSKHSSQNMKLLVRLVL